MSELIFIVELGIQADSSLTIHGLVSHTPSSNVEVWERIRADDKACSRLCEWLNALTANDGLSSAAISAAFFEVLPRRKMWWSHSDVEDAVRRLKEAEPNAHVEYQDMDMTLRVATADRTTAFTVFDAVTGYRCSVESVLAKLSAPPRA